MRSVSQGAIKLAIGFYYLGKIELERLQFELLFFIRIATGLEIHY